MPSEGDGRGAVWTPCRPAPWSPGILPPPRHTTAVHRHRLKHKIQNLFTTRHKKAKSCIYIIIGYIKWLKFFFVLSRSKQCSLLSSSINSSLIFYEFRFYITHKYSKWGALAQMAACLPLVQQVRGSIPGGVVNIHLKIVNLGARRGGDVHSLIARLYITVLD